MKLRHTVFAAALALLLAGCGSTSADESAMVRIDPGTTLQLVTSDGKKLPLTLREKSLTIAPYAHKPLLIIFFTTWCSSCRAEIPQMIDIRRRAGNDVTVLGILLEPSLAPEKLAAFIKETGINYPVTTGQANMDLARGMGGINAIPQMFLFAADGTLAVHYPGPVDASMILDDLAKLKGK